MPFVWGGLCGFGFLFGGLFVWVGLGFGLLVGCLVSVGSTSLLIGLVAGFGFCGEFGLGLCIS